MGWGFGGLRFQVGASGFGLRTFGFRFRASGLGCRVGGLGLTATIKPRRFE